MSQLIAVTYPDQFKAEEVRVKLRKLQREYLIELEDAVVVTTDKSGKIKLHQAVNLIAVGALSGGFWGTLIGMIFLNPLFGAGLGVAWGAVSGALTDVGIDDDFMKTLAKKLAPDTSALFVLVRNAAPDKVVAEIAEFGGTILRSSLSHEDEAKLQAALATGGLAPRGAIGGLPASPADSRVEPKLSPEPEDGALKNRKVEKLQGFAGDEGTFAEDVRKPASMSSPDPADGPEQVDRPGFDLGGSTGETQAGRGLGLGPDAMKNRKTSGLPR